ncbi:MAG: Transposase [Candidatus Kaiserbacteria bacterium GW2011_GWA2_49_19]|uniref:Transposase n=1 Tax=Candidatus Kaiserbacteria bacterium GW2011_GWA2_49_19 TaxID=1618669 RepID=A0A0G1VSI3_9BACT|nr:MAG: Transposase [Candidatus Kaiserbacteria bacterium GW2011_GWA2_49_19]
MSRNLEFSIGEFYHIYNRGVDKRKVFLSKIDYRRFVALLYACNNTAKVDLFEQGDSLEDVVKIERDETLTAICVYCLMPNHFHMILKEKIEGGISRFMQKLQTAYTMYFNERNRRSGALFQGTFKATHADSDEYLKYLVSYIHLNPVKLIEPKWKETGIADRAGAEKFLSDYEHSSYPDCTGDSRLHGMITDQKQLPEYFESAFDFKSAVREWLEFNIESPEG